MARASLAINNDIAPSASFHRKTFGMNIQLAENGSRATRHTSFDNGITFTSKQIRMNERVCMKIVDIDETGQWLGSLAIGFTQMDPDSIQRKELCKSALPNLCQKTGTSYIKRIFDKLSRQIIIAFYFNQDGAFYILDGREQELCKNVNVTQPLWGVIDIYGNVKGVDLIAPPQIVDGSRAFFIKYDQKPDKLPIRHFSSLNRKTDFQHLGFSETHGPELELFCQNMIAFRKNLQNLSRPYLFIDFPMTPGDEFYIRILSVDPNYRTPGFLGFTNAEKTVFTASFDKLPSRDPTALYDRKEFWILNEDAFDEKLSELDEYRFVFDPSGEMQMWRNSEAIRPTKTVAFADSSQKFYPFFFLNGRITALALMGIISTSRIAGNHPVPNEKADDDADLCKMCYDNRANCLLLPCSHIFFCSECRVTCEAKLGSICPVCRTPYENVIEIAD